MTLSERIQNTPTFKKMDRVKQSIYSKSEIRRKIAFALKMIELNDFDFWVEKTSPGIIEKQIVKDLIDT